MLEDVEVEKEEKRRDIIKPDLVSKLSKLIICREPFDR